MDGFDIATDRITTAASGVEQVGTSLRGEITTMDGLLADLQTGWQSSSAAPRFAAAMEGYLGEARMLTEALLSHGTSLAATSKAFDQTEEAIAAATPAVTA